METQRENGSDSEPATPTSKYQALADHGVQTDDGHIYQVPAKDLVEYVVAIRHLESSLASERAAREASEKNKRWNNQVIDGLMESQSRLVAELFATKEEAQAHLAGNIAATKRADAAEAALASERVARDALKATVKERDSIVNTQREARMAAESTIVQVKRWNTDGGLPRYDALDAILAAAPTAAFDAALRMRI